MNLEKTFELTSAVSKQSRAIRSIRMEYLRERAALTQSTGAPSSEAEIDEKGKSCLKIHDNARTRQIFYLSTGTIWFLKITWFSNTYLQIERPVKKFPSISAPKRPPFVDLIRGLRPCFKLLNYLKFLANDSKLTLSEF